MRGSAGFIVREPRGAALPSGEGSDRLAAEGNDARASLLADRVVLVLLVVLRVVTLALGAAEVFGSSELVHPLAATAALGALTAESVLFFGLSTLRLRRGVLPVLNDRTALAETVAGVAGLLVVAYATPLQLRTTSTFWIEPYTVISAVVIATARRVIVGIAGAVCLTATYLLCVFVWATDGIRLSAEAQATAWANAFSYLPFFAIGAIGFALVRTVVGNIDALRHQLEHESARLARLRAAGAAYDTGHDIAKAALRELRGPVTARLRSRAQWYRDELTREINSGGCQPLSLRDELNDLAVALEAKTTNFMALDVIPTDAPARLIVRAVRELLNNASHYAAGCRVTISARSSSEFVQVTVHDNGPGVDPAMLTSSLTSKEGTLHQLKMAGGDYDIVSYPGSAAGTTVTVTWPAVAHNP